MSREKRILKELEKKKAFRLNGTIGVPNVIYKIVDKNGNDVTKERIKDAVSN